MSATRLFSDVTPESAIAEAEALGPFVARVCLFSGGNDSLVCAHRCRAFYDELVFIDTGTAVPGVRDFVARAAAWLGKPLHVFEAPADEYRLLVLGGVDARGRVHEPLGFPGPAMHGRVYNRLKLLALEAMLRELKRERRDRVLALTGVRRAESVRRRHRPTISRRGSLVFCNPLLEWAHVDLHDYRVEHELPESDVAALLHRSGECNCGAFAAPGERAELEALWPAWFDSTIARLEREAREAGLEPSTWGHGRRGDELVEADLLCSDCQLRLEVEA